MTHKTGRLGRRYSRAGMGDPRGTWGSGVPASAGFMPEQQPILEGDGYVFAGPRPASSGVYDDADVSQVSVGRRYGVNTRPQIQIPQIRPASSFKPGMKLSRQGAQRTRGAPRRNR